MVQIMDWPLTRSALVFLSEPSGSLELCCLPHDLQCGFIYFPQIIFLITQPRKIEILRHFPVLKICGYTYSLILRRGKNTRDKLMLVRYASKCTDNLDYKPNAIA